MTAEESSSDVVASPVVALSTDEEESYDVVVVGAGPAGLSLGIGIAERCPHLSVAIVERRDGFVRAGATFGLAQNGALALAELCGKDFVEELQSKGIPVMGGLTMMMPWWTVRDALLERYRTLLSEDEAESGRSGTGRRLRLFTGLTAIRLDDEEDATAARIHFAGIDRVIGGRLIVGADGVHSTMRDFLGLDRAVDTGMTVYRGHVDLSSEVPPPPPADDASPFPPLTDLLSRDPGTTLLVVQGRTFLQAFNHHLRKPGLILWVVGTPTPPEGKSPQDLVPLFEDVADERESHFALELLRRTDPLQVSKSRMAVQDMLNLPERGGWGGKGRVTLIGDAAHAIRPVYGQGGSLAFEDCVVLCRHLSASDESDAGPKIAGCAECEDFVSKFEEERLPRVKTIHDDQRLKAAAGAGNAEPWSKEFSEWVYRGV